jgi:hypothetical protein
LRLLLDALASPSRCRALEEGQWDLLIRSARAARLLGSLASRLRLAQILDSVPWQVRQQLLGAWTEARYLRQMTLYELASVGNVLRPIGMPCIVLKGAAYIAQELPIAEGRNPRDLDLMVPRARLQEAEEALRSRGWMFDSKLTDYDQHYYRAWSHELPPLRLPGHAFEVDLHHTILPPIGRLKPNAARLISDSIPLPGSSFRVLRPADQLLHAVVHLFQDSDCIGKLRDLLDIDGLIRHFATQNGEGFWQQVKESVSIHGLGRPLWYALAFCRAWLQTPVPASVWGEMQAHEPPAVSRWPMISLAARALPPIHPDAEAGMAHRVAASLLEFRALWLRMPPWTLTYHGASKLMRSIRGIPASPSAG